MGIPSQFFFQTTCREPGVITLVQFVEGLPPKIWEGQKTIHFFAIFDNFRLRSRISPECIHKSKIELEWFNCLLPLQYNMSPLVVELELKRERERKLKLSGGAYARSPKFNAYTHRLCFLCPASYSVTDKHTTRMV